jgi:hypothetical protein
MRTMWPFRSRVHVDPTLGDANAKRLRADLARRNWRAAADFLASVTHPDDRTFYIRQAGDVPGVEAWIAEWIAAEPRGNTALLVAGQRYIAWAWEARGAYSAKHVKDEQFRLFFERLCQAEAALAEAAQRDHDDPTPWALMVVTARGLQHGQAEASARFREATGRYPWHLAAHMQMLQQVCPKWGGSYEALHSFAGKAIAEMPEGSSLGVLAPLAHLEHWLELDGSNHDEYIRRPGVLADLNAAADRSVRHPRFVRRAGSPALHNLFAGAFCFAGGWNAALEQFAATDNVVTELPWDYSDIGAQLGPKAGYLWYLRQARRRATVRS